MQVVKARKKIGPVNLPFNRPIRPISKRLRCGFRCGRIGPVNGGIFATRLEPPLLAALSVYSHNKGELK
jgi:hypothetical protein